MYGHPHPHGGSRNSGERSYLKAGVKRTLSSRNQKDAAQKQPQSKNSPKPPKITGAGTDERLTRLRLPPLVTSLSRAIVPAHYAGFSPGDSMSPDTKITTDSARQAARGAVGSACQRPLSTRPRFFKCLGAERQL